MTDHFCTWVDRWVHFTFPTWLWKKSEQETELLKILLQWLSRIDPNSLEAGERALFCGRRRRLSSALLNGLHKNTLAEMSRHQSKGRQSDWEEEEQKDPTDQRGLAGDFLGGLQQQLDFNPLTFSDISKHRQASSLTKSKKEAI